MQNKQIGLCDTPDSIQSTDQFTFEISRTMLCFQQVSINTLLLILCFFVNNSKSTVLVTNGQKLIYNSLELVWIDAYMACRRQGMELLTINTKEEAVSLQTTLLNAGISSQIWTSGVMVSLSDGSRNYYWFSNGYEIPAEMQTKLNKEAYIYCVILTGGHLESAYCDFRLLPYVCAEPFANCADNAIDKRTVICSKTKDC